MTHNQKMMVFAINCNIEDGRADVAGALMTKLAHELMNPIAEAQREHRAHSLVASQRCWQKVASAHGVAAWGYAYEGGQFNR